jgi:hypothetical protein
MGDPVSIVGCLMLTMFHAVLFGLHLFISTGDIGKVKDEKEDEKNSWKHLEKPVLNAAPVLMAFQLFTFVHCIYNPSWYTALVQLIVAGSYWYMLYST